MQVVQLARKWIRPVIIMVTLTVVCCSGMAQGAPPGMDAKYSHSTDSDGITTHAWRVGTVDDGQHWNVTVYHTRIDENNRALNNNTAIFKYKLPVAPEAAWSFWLGANKNDIQDFYPHSVMYDASMGAKGHVWASYSHEAIGTITAYEQNIHIDATGLSVKYAFDPKWEAALELRRMDYSDGNRRDRSILTFTRQLVDAWKIKGGYLYDGADRKATGKYYVPVQEKAWFLGLEKTVPIGNAKLVVSGDKSFGAKNSDGSIKRHGLGTELNWGRFAGGLRYERSGDYWVHSYHFSWQQTW